MLRFDATYNVNFGYEPRFDPPHSLVVFASPSADALSRAQKLWESHHPRALLIDSPSHTFNQASADADDELARARESTQQAMYQHVEAHSQSGCWQAVRSGRRRACMEMSCDSDPLRTLGVRAAASLDQTRRAAQWQICARFLDRWTHTPPSVHTHARTRRKQKLDGTHARTAHTAAPRSASAATLTSSCAAAASRQRSLAARWLPLR